MNSLYLLLGAATVGGGFLSGNRFFSTAASAEGVFHDVEIDFAHELADGEMKELKVGPKDEDKVLISRIRGQIYAVGNYCSHFGAPLSTGLLFDDKVLCPWHLAAFSVTTGALEHAPGLDGLPTFKVVEKDGKHFVQIPEVLPRTEQAPLAKRDPSNPTRYVIIGGGPAGQQCAETLRQSDFTGEVVVITAEGVSAYDRTLLTKVLGSGDASKFQLRSADYLQKADIDFKLATKVESVDTKTKTLKLSDGSTLTYDKLCIATGGTPFLPPIPGISLGNVEVLRTA